MPRTVAAKCAMGEEDFFIVVRREERMEKQENNLYVGGSVAWGKRKSKRKYIRIFVCFSGLQRAYESAVALNVEIESVELP